MSAVTLLTRQRTARAPITNLYLKALVSAQLAARNNDSNDSANTQQAHTRVLTLRLLPFERVLLDEVRERYLPPEDAVHFEAPNRASPLDPLGILLFFHWSWAAAVLRQALTELDPETVEDEHSDGGQVEAWEMFNTLIRTRNDELGFDRRHERADQLLKDNPEFVAAIGSIDHARITVRPHSDDLVYWRLITRIFRDRSDEMSSWPGFHAVYLLLSPGQRDTEEEPENLDPNLEDEEGILEAVERILADTPDGDDSDDDAQAVGEDVEMADGESAHLAEEDQEAQSGSDGRDKEGSSSRTERIIEWTMEQVDNILDASNVLDIWTMARQLRTMECNSLHDEVFQQLYKSAPFSAEWKTVRIQLPGEDFFQGHFPVKEFDGETLGSLMGEFFNDGFYERLHWAYRKRRHELSLTDPETYVPFIPEGNLQICTQEKVRSLLNDLGLDDAPDSTYCTMSASSWDIINHTLYLNEGLFQYQVEGYNCPGLLIREGEQLNLVFRKMKLEHTSFCKNLRRFWPDYNDCAITRDPDDATFYLLETLPGVKARRLKDSTADGTSRATAFFHLKWQYRESLADQRRQLKLALGRNTDGKEAFRPEFCDFLAYIDPRDLDLAGRTRIGEGRYGRVFRIRWAKKPDRRLDRFGEEPGDVAVKLIRFQNDRHDADGEYVLLDGKEALEARPKFFDELNSVYTALAGDASGCVPFFGFTRVPVGVSGDLVEVPDDFRPEDGQLALVFDFADDGTVCEYLSRVLTLGSPKENWKKLVSALNGMALGLQTIHSRGIVHRDLHLNNILVTSKYFANSNSTEHDAMLADLGEAKSFRLPTPSSLAISQATESEDTQNQPTSMDPTLYRESQAPSQPTAGGGSGGVLLNNRDMADDVYNWAQTAVDLIRLNFDRLADPSDGVVRFPTRLMRVLELCLSDDPEERLEAVLLSPILDTVGETIDHENDRVLTVGNGDEPEPSWIEGSYELPEVRRRLATSLQLTGSWMNTTDS